MHLFDLLSDHHSDLCSDSYQKDVMLRYEFTFESTVPSAKENLQEIKLQ